MKTAIYTLLAADATVSGLVLNRIYRQIAPAKTPLPYILYQRDTAEHWRTFSGAGARYVATLSVFAVAASDSAAQTLADAIAAVLSNYSGTVGSTVIHETHLLEEADSLALPIEASQTYRYEVEQTYSIHYT